MTFPDSAGDEVLKIDAVGSHRSGLSPVSFTFESTGRPGKEAVDAERAAACSIETMRTGGTCEACQ